MDQEQGQAGQAAPLVGLCPHCQKPLASVGWMNNANAVPGFTLLSFFHSDPECMTRAELPVRRGRAAADPRAGRSAIAAEELMDSGLQSRPYQPNPDRCCEACVFGRGEHAEWCAEARVWLSRAELIAMPIEEFRALGLLDYDPMFMRYRVRKRDGEGK